MKPKILITALLVAFIAVSVGYVIVKKAGPARTAAAPALVIAGVPSASARATAVIAARSGTAVEARASDNTITVYWFYDNKH